MAKYFVSGFRVLVSHEHLLPRGSVTLTPDRSIYKYTASVWG